MTKLLVVKGHPLTAEDSFSIKGLDTFVSAYKTANADDEVEVKLIKTWLLPLLQCKMV